MASGSLLTASQKAGPKAGPELAVMPSHAVSAKSQTLEKPSFPLIAPHAMSGVCSQVGDEGLEAFGSYLLFNRLRPVLIKQLGAHTGAELPLSQVVALLIERWNYMTLEEQGAITNLLTRSNGRIP